MATGNQIPKQLPEKSRLTNPLNVKKIDTTQVMVQDDVSVESLKNLLMSSLSLIEDKKSKKSDTSNSKKEPNDQEDENARESLQSCMTLFDTEESPLSNDGLWLQRNFGKPLVQSLRDVINKKPEDPVGYLAYCLRKYRSQEEVKQRKRDFDKELKTKRSSMVNQVMEEKELGENMNPKYYGDDEEGGGKGDWNFNNY